MFTSMTCNSVTRTCPDRWASPGRRHQPPSSPRCCGRARRNRARRRAAHFSVELVRYGLLGLRDELEVVLRLSLRVAGVWRRGGSVWVIACSTAAHARPWLRVVRRGAATSGRLRCWRRAVRMLPYRWSSSAWYPFVGSAPQGSGRISLSPASRFADEQWRWAPTFWWRG